jgi:hypothetical protein
MKPNFGLEPHLDQAAMRRAFRRLAALPPQPNVTISTVDVGRTRLDCAPIPPLGETLPGTLGPPTARQIEGKYDLIRESNPDGVTEVLVSYTYPEEWGVAEARMVFDADEHFTLADGQVISVLELKSGMPLRMEDGGTGTVMADPEFRTEHPVPPLPSDEGLWSSRVVGQVKHTTYEIIHFRWAGQEVRVTPGHVVWSEDRQWWIRAQELEPGELVRVAGNFVAPVEGPGRVRTGPVEVYGIEVEYFHNYFVGRGPDAMLVHNGPECVGKPARAESGKLRGTGTRAGMSEDPLFGAGYDAIFGNKGKRAAPTSRFEEYLQQVEDFTGVKLTESQAQRLKLAWEQHDKQLLSPGDYAKHKKQWEKPGFKDTVIDEWERQTGQKWPVHTEDVKSPSGNPLRDKGDRLDAHHFIEKAYGGPHEWWNIHPARYPDIHQGMIHGKDGIVHELMPQRK